MTVRLVLASASPGRLAVLRGAGVEPEVVVSGVDESGVGGAPAEVVLELARRKAHAVAALPAASGALVLGCDSLLELDDAATNGPDAGSSTVGARLGKPADPEQARQRWQNMAGRTGTLLTGHCLLDTRGPRWVELADVAAATVTFAQPSSTQIDAYVGSGEPLRVAGAFTLDGLGGWFVESVNGAPSTVVGVSLPMLRQMLAARDVDVVDLWPAGTDTLF